MFLKSFSKGGALSKGCDWLIVGLGNPGPKYAGTRHNVGFRALDLLAEHLGAEVRSVKFEALTGVARYRDPEGELLKLLLMKPATYMNLSGKAVRAAASYYKLPPERVLVLSDDVSLPVGRIRVRGEGSAGGHNGLKSIIGLLGSDAFPRVKIGVGESEYPDLADWVLSRPSGEDEEHIERACAAAGQAALSLIAEGVQTAAGKFNGQHY